MHKNDQAVAQQNTNNAAATVNANTGAQAIRGVNRDLGVFNKTVGDLYSKQAVMDPGLRRDLGTLYGSSISAGNAGTTEDVENLARRTGENSGAYAGIISEDRRARTRDANSNMAKADIQDETDRANRSVELAKLMGLGPDIYSRIYGSATGAQSADLGHATSAAGSIYQPSPWASIFESALGGAATVGAKAVPQAKGG